VYHERSTVQRRIAAVFSHQRYQCLAAVKVSNIRQAPGTGMLNRFCKLRGFVEISAVQLRDLACDQRGELLHGGGAFIPDRLLELTVGRSKGKYAQRKRQREDDIDGNFNSAALRRIRPFFSMMFHYAPCFSCSLTFTVFTAGLTSDADRLRTGR